jgi:hypothetical protein
MNLSVFMLCSQCANLAFPLNKCEMLRSPEMLTVLNNSGSLYNVLCHKFYVFLKIFSHLLV